MKVTEIEALIDFIAKSDLEEVNLETEQIKLAIKRKQPSAFVPQTVPAAVHNSLLPAISAHQTQQLPLDHTHEAEPSSHDYITFKAPLVGTFYQAPNPDASPFVQVGDRIQSGQKVCIIEAMKLFNEIEVDITGTIVKVLVDDASPVEYDQPLFLINPN